MPLRLEQIAGRLRAAGRRPHLIHVVGSSGALGAAAYLPAAEELVGQWKAHGIAPAALYVTAGSGLTVAGLALGLKHLGSPACASSAFRAQKPAAFMRPLIVERAGEAAALLGISTRIEATDIALDDRHIGPGYGIATPASVEAIELAARTRRPAPRSCLHRQVHGRPDRRHACGTLVRRRPRDLPLYSGGTPASSPGWSERPACQILGCRERPGPPEGLPNPLRDAWTQSNRSWPQGPLAGGEALVPQRPGLGVAINWDTVERYRTR